MRKEASAQKNSLGEVEDLVEEPKGADHFGYLHGLAILNWLRVAQEKGWTEGVDRRIEEIKGHIEQGDLPADTLERIGFTGEQKDILGYEEEPKEWRE